MIGGIIITKFNKQICEEIITLRSAGATKKDCAKYVGVNPKTINRWFDKGKEIDDEDDPYYQFYKAMLKAEAKFILYHLKEINNADDWRAHKYLLEVTDPETYVLEKRLNIKSDNDTTISLSKEDIFEKVDKELGLL